MNVPFLTEIVIILGLSVLIILLFHRIKMPSILGFLITGIIAGPYGLSLVKASEEVEVLSEIGVIFLLFVIGIEFSLKELAKIKNTVFIGGTIQVGGTILLTAVATHFFGLPWSQAVFMGFLISLSSTAIVMKVLQENGLVSSQFGRFSLAILIFQDIIVVPMMLITPLLGGQNEDLGLTILTLLGKFALVVVILILMARYVVPFILKLVIKTRNQELFILTIVVFCFATAWMTASVGLSLALGAFFAGLIISESDYSHQATASILPFREIFISFFFVSVGMLLDIRHLIDNVLLIILLTLGVILIKMVVVFITVLVRKMSSKTALLASFSLFQVGEFSFVLSLVGMKFGLLSTANYQHFLSVSILTMAITPFAMGYAEPICNWLLNLTIPSRVRQRLESKKQVIENNLSQNDILQDHLVIIGFGINGKNVALAAKEAKIPYVAVEFNPEIFDKAKKAGEPIVFGDASQDTILQFLKIQLSRVVVIAVSDPEITKTIIQMVRKLSPTTRLIVRTLHIREIDNMLKMGADEVIPEEFETSIEIFTRVLNHYMIPYDEIQKFTSNIRAHDYELLSHGKDEVKTPCQKTIHIPKMIIATLPVLQEANHIVGKTLAESKIRNEFDLNVLAIKRDGKFISKLDSETVIKTEDVVFLFGKPENVNKINKYFAFEG